LLDLPASGPGSTFPQKGVSSVPGASLTRRLISAVTEVLLPKGRGQTEQKV
jgi:hypothetical protein